MISAQWPIALAALLFAAGMWLLLPRGGRRGRRLGVGVAAAGLALLTLLVHCGLSITGEITAPKFAWTATEPPLGAPPADLVFMVLAFVTVVSAIASVTFRKPVYCAIWFALTLTGVAGLLLYQGAQFLGVATLVVYAGAILVTFLFVLMLAEPEGQAYYDRLSWEAALSACTGAVLVGLMTIVTSEALQRPQDKLPDWAASALSAERDANVLDSDHMAHLGKELFSKHLISVEVAGTLLLVALVGAVAIILHGGASPTPNAAARKDLTHG